MATLYKKVPLLVSRHYSHGGDGLETGPLVFFRNMEEYAKLAREHSWNTGKSYGTSWCVKPIEIQAHVQTRYLARFLEGQPLDPKHVLFDATQVTLVHHIGGWQ